MFVSGYCRSVMLKPALIGLTHLIDALFIIKKGLANKDHNLEPCNDKTCS